MRSTLNMARQNFWHCQSMTQKKAIVIPLESDSSFEVSWASYRQAADFLNFSNIDLVCLQHEYGSSRSGRLSHFRASTQPSDARGHDVAHGPSQPNIDQRTVRRKIATCRMTHCP